MKKIDNNLPSFSSPPITELVCGIRFQRLSHFSSTHFGLLQETFKNKYPYFSDNSTLFPPKTHAQTYEFTDLQPLRRVWFKNKKEDEDKIIQIQNNLFVGNWKKSKSNKQYSRYKNIIKDYKANYNIFTKFLKDYDIGTISPAYLELVYINKIPNKLIPNAKK